MNEDRANRRMFLKALGVVGAAGAVAAGSPEIDMGQSEAGEDRAAKLKSRPFWVREVDEPTMGFGEMNDEYQRWNPANDCFHRLRQYLPEGEYANAVKAGKAKSMAELKANRPGYSIRDYALMNAANLGNMSAGPFNGADEGIQSWQTLPWTAQKQRRLREAGLKYEAPPAEAARDVKAAGRLFGAGLVGIAALDRRLIYSHASNGLKPIVFEDVEKPYSTKEKYVIPESFKWVVVMAHRMSTETLYRGSSQIAAAATRIGYSAMTWTSGSMAEFIRGLGYEAVPMKNGFCQTVAFAVRAGLGELGRVNRLVTYEWGPNVRLSAVATNLPMALDKPINAGIAEFCRRCKKCAETCPSGALSLEDEPTWEVKGEFNQPGHKAWFPEADKCLKYWRENGCDCSICLAVCPWSKKDKAWAHTLVKVLAATVPALDGTMRRLDDAFGYGLKEDDAAQEAWWDLELPDYGVDSGHGKKEV